MPELVWCWVKLLLVSIPKKGLFELVPFNPFVRPKVRNVSIPKKGLFELVLNHSIEEVAKKRFNP